MYAVFNYSSINFYNFSQKGHKSFVKFIVLFFPWHHIDFTGLHNWKDSLLYRTYFYVYLIVYFIYT